MAAGLARPEITHLAVDLGNGVRRPPLNVGIANFINVLDGDERFTLSRQNGDYVDGGRLMVVVEMTCE